MLRFAFMAAALSLGAAAHAQTATPAAPNPAVQQVQLLAPQLLAFAGSPANFQSLINGLTQAAPVTLTTLNTDGTLQIATFAPGTTLSPVDAARTLETARQGLITQGIATPTAQQLAVALMGGALPTPLGTTTFTGALSGNAGATPIQVRTETATAVPGTGASAGISQASLQALQAALSQNTAVTLPGAAGNVTFNAPGRALTPFEANQALQLASLQLAQQGILNPTAEQLRAALLGGNIVTAAGTVPLQGVLQGQVRNTSDSPLFGASDSRALGTSNTPPQASVPSTPAAVSSPAAAGATARGAVTPRIGAVRR